MRWKDVSARKQNGSETDGPRTFGDITIHWTCEDDLSLVPGNCVTIQNPDFISSSQTGISISKLKKVPCNHLFLYSAANLGPLIPLWEINKFKNCCYKSVRILEVLKLLFLQCLNLSSFQRDMSRPILGEVSNNSLIGDQGELV